MTPNWNKINTILCLSAAANTCTVCTVHSLTITESVQETLENCTTMLYYQFFKFTQRCIIIVTARLQTGYKCNEKVKDRRNIRRYVLWVLTLGPMTAEKAVAMVRSLWENHTSEKNVTETSIRELNDDTSWPATSTAKCSEPVKISLKKMKLTVFIFISLDYSIFFPWHWKPHSILKATAWCWEGVLATTIVLVVVLACW